MVGVAGEVMEKKEVNGLVNLDALILGVEPVRDIPDSIENLSLDASLFLDFALSGLFEVFAGFDTPLGKRPDLAATQRDQRHLDLVVDAPEDDSSGRYLVLDPGQRTIPTFPAACILSPQSGSDQTRSGRPS